MNTISRRLLPLVGSVLLTAALFVPSTVDAQSIETATSPATTTVQSTDPAPAIVLPARTNTEETLAQSRTSDDTNSSRSTPIAAPARQRRWDLNLIISNQFPLGSDQLVLPGQWAGNQPFFDGSIQYRVDPRVRVYFKKADKGNVGGRTYSSRGVAQYGGYSNDIQTTYGFSYSPGRNEQYDFFGTYRYRTCCPGAADPTNTAQRHYRGFGIGYTNRFGHNSKIGKPFTVYGEETRVNHRYDVVGGSSAGDVGPQWILTSSYINIQARVWGQEKLIPYYQYEHFSTLVDNNLTSTGSNRTRIGFRLPGNRLFSYNIYVKNTHPFNPTVNSTHDVGLFIDTTVKVQF